MEALLLDCCSCAAMGHSRECAGRPFPNINELLDSRRISAGKSLEHEAIGWRRSATIPKLARKLPADQNRIAVGRKVNNPAARVAAEDVKTLLARGNRLYYDKFGYIYIVCATGKSAEEILALLEERLQNDPEREASHRRRAATADYSIATYAKLLDGERNFL